MKNWLCVLLAASAVIFADEKEPDLIASTPDQIASLSSEDLIGGVVSPLSGQVVIREIDLVAPGVQPIEIGRVYVPLGITAPSPVPPPEGGNQLDRYRWFSSHREYWAYVIANYRGWQHVPQRYVVIKDGKALITDQNGSVLEFKLKGGRYELTTPLYGIGSSSGEKDPRNIRISSEGEVYKVTYPDGLVRIYKASHINAYTLQKEILPNGKILRYTIDSSGIFIESLDPQERYVYATAKFDGKTQVTAGPDQAAFNYDATQNRKLRFKQKKGKKGKYNDLAPIEEEYDYPLPPILTRASTPNYRSEICDYTSFWQLSQYKGKDNWFMCAYDTGVSELSFPVGSDGSFETVYWISYNPPVAGQRGGSTQSIRADGVTTIYYFSQELLTTSVETYDPSGKLQMKKNYDWSSDHRLKMEEVLDGSGSLFYRKTYANYDPNGNPQLETFSGNLSGEGRLETWSVRREYSPENLLLKETDDEGKTTLFSYLPSTRLMTAKTILDGTQTVLQMTWTYDDCYNLIEETTSDATQKTITRYRLSQDPSTLHLPEWIETYYLDGTEKLLKKVKLAYDSRGHVAEEQIYDANGNFAWTIKHQYDEQGNLVSETNAMGDEALYAYTPEGKCSYSRNFSGRLEKKMTYDFAGRLEHMEEGKTRLTSFNYDPLNRCIEKTDYFGQTTNYTPDPVTGKTAKTQGPLAVVSSKTYDPLGREIQSIDPNGHITKTQYNAYGSPVTIHYPNGAIERFSYHRNGNLKSHTDREGTTTEYDYDILDRIISKTTWVEGEQIASETYTYSAFNLLSETDKEGNLTTYTYDKAGRKTSETAGVRVTNYFYDPMNRLIKTKNSQTTCQVEWDPLDRLLKERYLDKQGKVLSKIRYAYDKDGNQIAVYRYPQNEEKVETFEYDPFGRLIAHTDPLGNITTTYYDETGPTLTKITTDPLSLSTLITYDPYQRETHRQIGSTYREERTYDPAGNLLQIQEGDLITRYTYNSLNLPSSLTRAFGTADARTSSYTYTPSGRLLTQTQPDGTILSYTYDPFGYRESLLSSDGTIFQTFRSNKLGHLLYASDKSHILQRKVDRFGNILEESIDGTLTLKKSYDEVGHLTTLTLPDGSSIAYEYNPLYLSSVTRLSPQGDELYSHTYTDYDLMGLPLKEVLPINAGTITHTYYPDGREKKLLTPYLVQNISYDAKGRVANISGEGEFSYDELSQLTQDRSTLTYSYDDHFNRVQDNENTTSYNLLDQISDLPYDLNGNLVHKNGLTYSYDALNRLTSVASDEMNTSFTYDALNRCISKTSNKTQEFYLYHNSEELGSFAPNGATLNLKVPGLYLRPVALELENQTVLPILDYRGNIRRLVSDNQTIQQYEYSAFGEEYSSMPHANPWRYSSKRYHPEIMLYSFGQRYYDPTLGRWLTPDPAGFIDGTNLYAYLLNDPLNSLDPNGNFAIAIPLVWWGLELALPSLYACVAPIVYGAVTGTLVYGGYKLVEYANANGIGSMGDYYTGDLSPISSTQDYSFWKNYSIYAPDRPLPRDPRTREPVPETDAPHTELGTRNGEKGPYPQAREFDAQGKPVKDVDFTDHGRPKNHPNPHEHQWKPNPTGGTPERSNEAKPLSNYRR
ncbi:MAG: hypothetical protein JSS32_04865 [Verrucomicrobia bacterium]|nr:hypothetical protein [Verrucomicrobiota bacterium]